MTTYLAGTRGDALQPQSAAVEIPMHGIAGAVPGTAILAAGGANGPGVGTLRQESDLRLQWKAPGSSSFGELIMVSAGGSFLLEDGDNAEAWVRVKVTPSFQIAGVREEFVYTQDVFNLIGPDDVTAGEALAGAVETFSVDLLNTSGMEVVAAKAWLDPLAVGLEISTSGGGPWVAPTTEGSALALGNVAPAASTTLHLRRTIGAASPSS